MAASTGDRSTGTVVVWHRRGFRMFWRLLYVLLIVRHERRMVVHWNITESPTTAWTAQQVVEAFPFDFAPDYLLRDRDSICGGSFVKRVNALGIEEKVISPRSPWQNPIAERLIGSIRCECLDRVIVLNERHLRRLMVECCDYYHRSRTHRSLGQDAPPERSIEPPEPGKVVEFPMVGGLHHLYRRQAA
jgi:putative transposase